MIDFEKREKHWQQVIEPYLKTFWRKKQVAAMHKVYQGEGFDPLAKEFDFLDGNVWWLFYFRPVQNEDVWRDYCLNEYKVWTRAKDSWGAEYNLESARNSILPFDDLILQYGWDVEVEIKLHRFLWGENFQVGEYEFLGYDVDYPSTPGYYFNNWLGKIYWYLNEVSPEEFSGRVLTDDNKFVYLREFAMSTLPYFPADSFVNTSEDYWEGLCLDMADSVLDSLATNIDKSIENSAAKKENIQKLIATFTQGSGNASFDELVENKLKGHI